MRKKIVVLLAAATVTAASLAGCQLKEETGNSAEATSTEKENSADSGGEKFIGISMPSTTNEFLASITNEMKEQLEAEGIKVEVTSAEEKVEKQLEAIENLVSMGIDNLIIMPVDGTQVGPALADVRKAGVEVDVIGARVENGAYDKMYLTDQREVGENNAKSAAEWIEKTFPDAEPGSVEVVTIATNTVEESKARSEGSMQVTEFTDKAKVVGIYEITMGESVSKVQEYADMMMIEHPDVKAVITYDGPQALAIDEVVMRSGFINKEEFGIFAADWSEEIGNHVKDSANNDSMVRSTIKYGDNIAGDVVKMVNGTVELDDDNIYSGPIYTVTSENVSDYLGK